MARASDHSNSNVSRLIEYADIVNVALRLGLQLDKRATRPRRALCPFHDDHSPSLHLYQAGAGRDHFHCFVCGAHGDTVALIQRREGLEFWDAVRRLAEFEGVELPERGRTPIDRRSGAMLFAERLREAQGGKELAEFAERRGFTREQLHAAGAAVYELRGLRADAQRDRVLEERLVQAGILREAEDADGATPSLFAKGLRGFFSDRRLVLPLNDLTGAPVGFAARALSNSPRRYLYSYGLPRRDTLYGADRVLRSLAALDQRSRPVCIYVVEGLFDQLRFKSLGMHAVAILGARITPSQVARLAHLMQMAEEAGRELTIRIFLDPDEAGRRGAFDAVLAVMRLLDSAPPFRLEIIVPPEEDKKLDPDEFLRGKSPEDTERLLNNSSVKPLRFLLAVATGGNERSLDLQELGSLRFAAAARRIANALPEVSWTRVLAPLDENDTTLGGFADLIRSYGERVPGTLRAPSLSLQEEGNDDRADLIAALTMGRSSTARREYPLDDDAWERLAIAASPFFHIHSHRLKIGDGPSEPLLARHLPKGEGRYRLKAGPVAADALLQQYALVQLLRERPEAPGFTSLVPAVRYLEDPGGSAKIYRTGLDGEREALSFAYQVDMAIVNGETPPRREGIFRPYFECWRSFIDFLDRRIRRYRHEELQILRLDVTGFYEYIMRDVVGDALQQPLERALALLGQSTGGPLAFAPLLQPDRSTDAAERAAALTEFLLRHSFEQSHRHPETGEIDRVKGLPQGPDLSAYLANISLFSLDDLMAAEIDRLDAAWRTGDEQPGLCSAAYARYVDDIIIICPTMEIAAQLRRKVEAHLQIKGLSLNRKNPTPPPMTRAEARAWLTDNRAGFGFSGPLAEMPVTESMDPLADAGDINRRTALGLLYDPELDDVRNVDLIIQRIGLALRAVEVRFSDRANAYRRLWQIAAIKANDGDADEVANTFWDLLSEVEPAVRLLGDDATDIALACLEALDRALRSRMPEGVADDIRKFTLEGKQRLANATLGDVLSPLAAKLFVTGQDVTFLRRYDVRCQVAIIACLAADGLGSQGELKPFERLMPLLRATGRESARTLPEGLRLSLYRHDPSFESIVQPLTVPSQSQGQSVFHRLETALVRLQRFDGSGKDLPPTEQVIEGADILHRLTSLILRVWSPSDDAREAEQVEPVEFDAASTLVNVTYQQFAAVAERRPRLIHLIVEQKGAQALPSPPGLATSGVLLWCDDGRLLLASAGDAEPALLGVVWQPTSTSVVGQLRLMQANLEPGFRPLFSDETAWTPARIASTYRAGFDAFTRLLDPASDDVPIPTAFSFFGVERDGVLDPPGIRLICWTAPRRSVDNHAFVRSGTALEARGVHAKGADYWRFGWALRDLCGRVDGGGWRPRPV